MKNLTLFYIKKRLPLFLIVLGISLVGSIVFVGTTEFVYYGRIYDEFGNYIIGRAIGETSISALSSLMLVFAAIIPIYEFSFKMKKTGCDLFYSLPIKRNKLYLFKYIFGICEMISIFLINFIIIVIVTSIKLSGIVYVNATFTPGYYFLFLLVIIGIGIVVYSFVAFFYTRGNTFLDGLLSVFMSSVVVMAAVFGIFWFFSSFEGFHYSVKLDELLRGTHYVPFIAGYEVADVFDSLIQGKEVTKFMAPSIIGIIISSVSIPLFIILCGKDRAEDSEDITDSWFTYKLMLPIFIISLFMMLEFKMFIWIGVVIGGYIGYVIYDRNFLLRKKNLITLVICIIIGMGLMGIKIIAR